jgi:RNA polymerase sigma factor for flagellar operon FliA
VDRATATTALADAARTVAPLDELTAGFLATAADSPEGSLLLAEQMHYVQAAVSTLPEKMRHIVTQVYFEERPVKDVAEELGLSHAAVSQQRGEGIRLLREALEAHYGHAPSTTPGTERRISASRRNAYLAAVAERTVGGITRALAPTMVGAEAS